MIFYIFYQVNNLLLHQSYFKSPLPGQINPIKKATNHFLLLKKSKNTSSALNWTKLVHLCGLVGKAAGREEKLGAREAVPSGTKKKKKN